MKTTGTGLNKQDLDNFITDHHGEDQLKENKMTATKPKRTKKSTVKPEMKRQKDLNLDNLDGGKKPELTIMNGVPMLNTSTLLVQKAWLPPSKYIGKIIAPWEKAVRDLYMLSREKAPDDIAFGVLYTDNNDELSGRIGNTFLISPFKMIKTDDEVFGFGGTRCFKKRYENFIKTAKGPGLREQFHRLALIEVSKTIGNKIEGEW